MMKAGEQIAKVAGKKIVVIGAVAGGASAAARARRLDEHATITMIEKAGDPSIANCGMPYWLVRARAFARA